MCGRQDLLLLLAAFIVLSMFFDETTGEKFAYMSRYGRGFPSSKQRIKDEKKNSRNTEYYMTRYGKRSAGDMGMECVYSGIADLYHCYQKNAVARDTPFKNDRLETDSITV